jgi:hypothetical protein
MAWDRIDEAYRAWILSAGVTAEEFNDSTVRERFSFRAAFDARSQQQQDGEKRCCSRILVFNLWFEYGNTPSIYIRRFTL